jgi:hypothetical protein
VQLPKVAWPFASCSGGDSDADAAARGELDSNMQPLLSLCQEGDGQEAGEQQAAERLPYQLQQPLTSMYEPHRAG